MTTTTMRDLADKVLDGHTPIAPVLLLPWRRRAIHKLVDRAEHAGVLNAETVDWLVSTAALGRHVWHPEQVEALVAAGLLADDGPVDNHPDRRWYVVAEVTA